MSEINFNSIIINLCTNESLLGAISEENARICITEVDIFSAEIWRIHWYHMQRPAYGAMKTWVDICVMHVCAEPYTTILLALTSIVLFKNICLLAR